MRIDRRAPCMAALGTVAAVSGCNGTTSYLDATGVAGHDEAVLGIWLTAASCAVVLIVCVAILAAMARHRGENNAPRGDAAADTTRRDIPSGLRWIYVGTAVTVAVLLVTFAGTMVTLNATTRPTTEPPFTMDVIGHQWWWEIRYADPEQPSRGFVTANEVHLPIGIPVRVRLRSADVIHSFWIPQIAGKTDAIPGQTNEMWVEATQPGTSRGMCGEYCGLQHSMMALAVTAESPAEFNKWMQERQAPPPATTTTDERMGAVVFARSCGACHSVTGSGALGRVGPDLSHVASRPFIGAGVLDNTPANLMTWITNAPAVKEGARMPAIPLDGSELQAVVAYLRTLR